MQDHAQPLWLAVPGGRLEAAWHGPPPQTAPTLVLLHEGLGCVSTWRQFPAELSRATGWGVLVYSRAGYGRSAPCELPRPLDYMQQHGLATLGRVLAAASVRDHVLVGHSDGASIALVHAGAVARPDLRGVVALAPHTFVEPKTIAAIERSRDAFVGGDLRERLERHHGDNTDCAFWGWNRAWLDPGFREWNIDAYVDEIDVPVVVVQGRDDPYGTLAQVVAIERRATGPVTRTIVGGGHAPHREHPTETIAAIRELVGVDST